MALNPNVMHTLKKKLQKKKREKLFVLFLCVDYNMLYKIMLEKKFYCGTVPIHSHNGTAEEDLFYHFIVHNNNKNNKKAENELLLFGLIVYIK